jgi:4-diphosphocytidyl-2-C-methyl-D-erythritol kinase
VTLSREVAYAKINLALHVRRRRADGYHDIETLFAFAEDGDVITALPGEAGLRLDGPFAEALRGEDSEDNLVMRAARRLAGLLGRDDVPGITLDKRLPVAAGIGGGSADGAAVLRLLCRRYGIALDDPRVATLAGELGADVPACLASVAVRGDERGDRLIPVETKALTGLPLLLVNPRTQLSTGAVFAAWDQVDRGPLLESDDPLSVACASRNDLEPPAQALCPVISEVVGLLEKQPGVMLTRMSGSGATCFALFDGTAERDAAAAAVTSEHPDWWLLPTRLR